MRIVHTSHDALWKKDTKTKAKVKKPAEKKETKPKAKVKKAAEKKEDKK